MKENPKYKIAIPNQVVERLHIKPDAKLKLTLRRQGMVVEKINDGSADSWNVSIWWSLIPAILTAVMVLIFFKYRNFRIIPLSGQFSIASGTIVFGLIFGALLFTIFLVKSRKNPQNTIYRNIYWRNFPTIVLSFTASLLVGLLGIFWILGIAFKGATFDVYTATIIIAVLEGIVNYVMIGVAVALTPTLLVDLLNLIIVSGVLISMSSNSHRYWWKHNLSFLGTSRATDSWQFNLTIIFSALLMWAVIDFLFVSLKSVQKPTVQTWILRTLMTLMAFNVAAIGIIPNDIQVPWMHFWHTQFGWSLVWIIIILIAGIRWLWPGISKNFLKTSYLIGFLLVLASILFQVVHYFSLTAFEITSFTLAFAWILMLFQYILNVVNKGILDFTVTLTQNK
ncbi:hypothetical protein [Fructilactobacillus fructivorans]|uniref:DUF998 domain-containing protein n=1 Tax=Fructilactobacillus fructivorans TaxID=1614 RepID=A0AAE6NZK2_9LACO|nr:hypothetical protein [Fructilactobacillus fructivorans]KRK58281.1 putative ABC transporter, permease protein (putative) [Fructilactobacillus fructivorans]KRN40841.1 putative ABC transporter, permease protein (putative) [Fructilactobacillus fructivorans]QFX92259.1 DUF998 domain-containing protein [Fructilactobacillus fructivorans]RDV65310.1 DUF998 domain-containing protein [Fructilactobacillus fructivorans]